MYKVLSESLKLQSQCPLCKADWGQVEGMLHEHMASQNYTLALLIIWNCPACSERFKGAS